MNTQEENLRIAVTVSKVPRLLMRPPDLWLPPRCTTDGGYEVLSVAPSRQQAPGDADNSRCPLHRDDDLTNPSNPQDDSAVPPSLKASDRWGNSVPRYEAEDVAIGKAIGRGSFCVVHDAEIANDRRRRGRTEDGGAPLVLKRLSPAVKKDAATYVAAAVDLAQEANILSELKHDNVVRLRGISKGCVVADSTVERGCYLVLEKLRSTLLDAMYRWRDEDRRNKRSISILASGKVKRKVNLALLARMNVALEIAEGLRYLHSQGVVYRDLKPQNVGFDHNGRAKIFDFGLAKKLKAPYGRTLASYTGTPKYMAPEMARGERYGLEVDVYSYGLLLWEMLSLHRLIKGERPEMQSKWLSQSMKGLLKSCLTDNPDDRPGFDMILSVLGKEMSQVFIKCKKGKGRFGA